MTTSRTGTSEWKRLRAQALRLARTNGLTQCPHCGVELDYEWGLRPNSAEVDHVEPWSHAGTNQGPLVVICRRCNQSKGNRAAPKQATVLAAKPLRTSREW